MFRYCRSHCSLLHKFTPGILFLVFRLHLRVSLLYPVYDEISALYVHNQTIYNVACHITPHTSFIIQYHTKQPCTMPYHLKFHLTILGILSSICLVSDLLSLINKHSSSFPTHQGLHSFSMSVEDTKPDIIDLRLEQTMLNLHLGSLLLSYGNAYHSILNHFPLIVLKRIINAICSSIKNKSWTICQ